MSNIETGGPAFPCDLTMYDQEVVTAFQGATLRDYFAAKVIQGICASNPDMIFTNNVLSKEAYAIADAMLKARKE